MTEQGKQFIQQIMAKMNAMTPEERVAWTEKAVNYCKRHHLLTKEDWNNPDKDKMSRKAITLMELREDYVRKVEEEMELNQQDEEQSQTGNTEEK